MTAPQRTCSTPSRLPKPAQISTETRALQIRYLCVALLVIGLFIGSCFATGSPVTRALLAFIPIVVFICGVELAIGPEHNIRSRKRWRIRPAQIEPVRLCRSVLLILLHTLIAWVALHVLFRTVHPKNITTESLRFGAGIALLYSSAVVIAEAVNVLFLSAGFSFPCAHRTPIAARTVGEFWNCRWNILVSAWLHTYIFLPVARCRGAASGIFCAFLVSGLFHGWPILMALGKGLAFMTTAFFVIQGVAVLAENRLRIHTWPIPIARAWTWGILLVPSPLFFNPALRLFGL